MQCLGGRLTKRVPGFENRTPKIHFWRCVPRKGGEYGEGRSRAVKRYYGGREHHISWLEDSL